MTSKNRIVANAVATVKNLNPMSGDYMNSIVRHKTKALVNHIDTFLERIAGLANGYKESVEWLNEVEAQAKSQKMTDDAEYKKELAEAKRKLATFKKKIGA